MENEKEEIMNKLNNTEKKVHEKSKLLKQEKILILIMKLIK